MRIAVYLPLLLAVILAAMSPLAARRLPPAAATRTLTVAALITAAASTWSLALIAASALGWLPALPREAHISFDAWQDADPIPPWVGALAATALLAVGLSVTRLVIRQRHERRCAEALCRQAPNTEMLVLPAATPSAVAVPSRDGGRIVVTTAMLQTLTAAERRVMFAHERAHLDHQHHRYRRITALAAAANPLLRRLRDDVGYTCERWADEAAASTTGTDRRLAARALTRAAQAALGPTAAPNAAAFERLNVADRVAALHANPPRIWLSLLLGCALLTVAAAIAEGDATMSFARFFADMIPAVRDVARTTDI